VGGTIPTDLNTLIGVIERNQQAIGQLCMQMNTLRVEIMSQQQLCRVEHKGVSENLFRLSEELITALEEHREIMEVIKTTLLTHKTQVDSNDPALLAAIGKLAKKDDWIRNFMVIVTSISGIMTAIIISIFVYLNSSLGGKIQILIDLLSKFKH